MPGGKKRPIDSFMSFLGKMQIGLQPNNALGGSINILCTKSIEYISIYIYRIKIYICTNCLNSEKYINAICIITNIYVVLLEETYFKKENIKRH